MRMDALYNIHPLEKRLRYMMGLIDSQSYRYDVNTEGISASIA